MAEIATGIMDGGEDFHRLELTDDGGGGPVSSSKATLLSRSLTMVSAATYNAKKTAAQGMMDIALLTANANQLRYILEFRGKEAANFAVLLVLIVCSLVLQVLVGIMLIFKGRMNSTSNANANANAIKLNNYMVLGVFLITTINIFIAAFTMSPT